MAVDMMSWVDDTLSVTETHICQFGPVLEVDYCLCLVKDWGLLEDCLNSC